MEPRFRCCPRTKRQVRPLTRFRDQPDRARAAWTRAVETAPRDDHDRPKVTAALVQDAVRDELAARRDEIAAALDKLATHGSPDQIADHLREQLIRGVCGDPAHCAIAAWIQHAVPAARRLVVYVDRTKWSAWDPAKTVHPIRHDMPDQVGRFIRRFDAGGYPELRTAESPAFVPAPF